VRPAPAVAFAVLLAACDSRPAPRAPADPGPVPAELAEGERLYDARCSGCHGELGAGTGNGPPLVHRVYEPSHHGDAAFQRAVALGTRAHHWRFGDMPPVAGLDDEAVQRITAYVRWLQRNAGIE
jgi:mono/diheme cytochrome c family protein